MKTLLTVLLFFCFFTSYGQSEKDIEYQVEKLKLALLDPSEATLKDLTSPSLTYGHSSGLLENQDAFIEALVSGKSDFESISFTDQSVVIEKNVGIVRHILIADIKDGDKKSSIRIGVMLVWQKEKREWKLIARQAYKLP